MTWQYVKHTEEPLDTGGIVIRRVTQMFGIRRFIICKKNREMIKLFSAGHAISRDKIIYRFFLVFFSVKSKWYGNHGGNIVFADKSLFLVWLCMDIWADENGAIKSIKLL